MKALMIPKNFDAEKLISSYKPKNKNYKPRPFHLNYIMHSVLNLIEKNYRNGEMHEYHKLIVPLSTESLARVLNNYYFTALDCLLENGILTKIRGYYQLHCATYRLDDEYYTDTVIIKIDEKEYAQTLKAFFVNDEFNESKRIDSRRKHLFKIFDSGNLRFSDSAFDILNQKMTVIENDYSDDVACFNKLKNSIQSQKNAIVGFNNNTINNEPHSDVFGRRFHSTITFVESDLRKHLIYKDESLVEIDLKNCLPFLILIFLREDFWNKPSKNIGSNVEAPITLFKFYSLGKVVHNGLRFKGLINLLTIPSLILVNETNEAHLSIDNQLNRYIKEVTTGHIYEQFMEELGLINLSEEEFKANRKIVKNDIISFLNECPAANFEIRKKRAYTGTIRPIFEKLYPVLVELIDALKSFKTDRYVDYSNKVSRRKKTYSFKEAQKLKMPVDYGYKLFASLLQRIESYIMLDVICKNLMKKYSNIPIVTIHDCIMTTNEYVDLVIKEIENTFLKYIGYKPLLEVENGKKTFERNNRK